MKGNTISVKPLHESGQLWLAKTLQLLKVQEYGKPKTVISGIF
jgi:hypothetical protein